jgi:hypothetical protein
VKEICGEDNYKKTLPERLQRGHWKYYYKNKNIVGGVLTIDYVNNRRQPGM